MIFAIPTCSTYSVGQRPNESSYVKLLKFSLPGVTWRSSWTNTKSVKWSSTYNVPILMCQRYFELPHVPCPRCACYLCTAYSNITAYSVISIEGRPWLAVVSLAKSCVFRGCQQPADVRIISHVNRVVCDETPPLKLYSSLKALSDLLNPFSHTLVGNNKLIESNVRNPHLTATNSVSLS